MRRLALLVLPSVGAFAAEPVAEDPVCFVDARLKVAVEGGLGQDQSCAHRYVTAKHTNLRELQ
jgi:hypothetical protein